MYSENQMTPSFSGKYIDNTVLFKIKSLKINNPKIAANIFQFLFIEIPAKRKIAKTGEKLGTLGNNLYAKANNAIATTKIILLNFIC